ncbi:MAG TPA: glycoside hydrolase family 38 C-terminal domain-containing protein [Solirubrobacteraceae bacterium]
MSPEDGSATWEFYVVPHTHWDREWYRPFEHFQLALGRVVDGVLDVLERDPTFTSFTLDGQAIVLEDYLEVRPEHESRLRALVAAGRIELGPSYMLPDEFLVSGEPLVRNLLIGRAVCRRLGGEPTPTGYLPDSFGHPLQLPQILAGFGIRSFVFSRGMGDELDEVGVVFRWRAPDGSEVLAFQQLDHYGNFAFVSGGEDGGRRVRGILERFGPWLERAGVRHVLLCNGTDHVPVASELPALCQELQDRLAPSTFRIAKYADYVDAVGEIDAPAWSGELLGSRIQNVLRGVNSARLYVKRANEAAERRLLEVETLGALRTLHDGSAFPRHDLELAWRQLLRCQPHDTICGCSCDEVHRDAMARYESLHRTLGVLQDRAAGGIGVDGAPAGSVGVANLLPFRRRRLVELPDGRESIVELDGLSARVIELPPRGPDRPAVEVAAIESDRFRVEATAAGALNVVDRSTGRRFEGLHMLEDEPDMGDLYNFCPVGGARIWRSTQAATRVVRAGPVVWELEVRIEAALPAGLDHEHVPLTQRARLAVCTVVRLVRGSGRIEFRTTIENAAEDHRLRVGFPVGPGAGLVRAETAFAVARRPAQPPPPRASWTEPPDATQHTLGAVAFGSAALLTKGLPEYEAREPGEQGELWLTLLRCVGVISQPEGALVTRPHTAGPQVLTPEGQCLGRQQAEYAFVPDGNVLDDAALLREAQDYRHGFLVTDPISLEPSLALGGDVVFSCLKGAEDGDGLILRCFNPGELSATARVAGSVGVWRTRLDETGEEILPEGRLELGPGEIGTVRLRAVSSRA